VKRRPLCTDCPAAGRHHPCTHAVRFYSYCTRPVPCRRRLGVRDLVDWQLAHVLSIGREPGRRRGACCQSAIAGESEMGLPGDLAGARTIRARIILRSGRSRPATARDAGAARGGGRRQAHPASRRTGRGRPFGSLVLAARSIGRPFDHHCQGSESIARASPPTEPFSSVVVIHVYGRVDAGIWHARVYIPRRRPGPICGRRRRSGRWVTAAAIKARRGGRHATTTTAPESEHHALYLRDRQLDRESKQACATYVHARAGEHAARGRPGGRAHVILRKDHSGSMESRLVHARAPLPDDGGRPSLQRTHAAGIRIYPGCQYGRKWGAQEAPCARCASNFFPAST
jgi:hypothetical protein